MGTSKIFCFRFFSRFLELRAHDFHRFWVPKVIPGARFPGGFLVIGFIHDFLYIFWKKDFFSETLKTLQSTAPASKIKGHRFEKKARCVKRTHRKKTSIFHRFLPPNRPKKRIKCRLAPRMTKTSLRERSFSAPGAILVDFRVPERTQNSSKMRSRT